VLCGEQSSLPLEEFFAMNKMMIRAGAVLAMASLVLPAVAQKDGKKPAANQCPACKMAMTPKKTAKTTVAVQLKKGGKVYFCCDHCKMDPKILVKSKSSDTKM
jgi:hypothetical protein